LHDLLFKINHPFNKPAINFLTNEKYFDYFKSILKNEMIENLLLKKFEGNIKYNLNPFSNTIS
jgi:hypothetical protein